jgi:hypothetical protein
VEYKIPVLSYVDVACSLALQTGKHDYRTRTAYWGRELHHDKKGHKFVALVASLAVFEYSVHDGTSTVYDNQLPAWMPNVSAITPGLIADWQAYVYDPTTTAVGLDDSTLACLLHPSSRGLVTTFSGAGKQWRYFEDVPGKPGWIVMPTTTTSRSSSPFAREIKFKVKLSKHNPKVKLSLLSSYDKQMGQLTCCVEARSDSHCSVFNTLWHDKTSQVTVFEMKSLPDFSYIMGDKISMKLTCTANKGKIKIVDVMSC